MEFLYIDERSEVHHVRLHNFDKRDSTKVRVIGSIRLNPSDTNYPDKKWVRTNELYVKATFNKDFIKKNSY